MAAGFGQTQRQLTANDVTNQGGYLLDTFIHERMQRDGYETGPASEQLQERGTPGGHTGEHLREIGRAIKLIGNELDEDQRLNELVSRVPPEAERQTIFNVASNIFRNGIDWGKVVALFWFAYKLCVKALNRIQSIINFFVDFMREHVVRWIMQRGGWETIEEYVGTPQKQFGFVVCAGVAACAGVYAYHRWFS